MARVCIGDNELRNLALFCNEHGYKALVEHLKSNYEIKYPYSLTQRMRKKFLYNPELEKFDISESENEKNIFMSIEELCSPTIVQDHSQPIKEDLDSRPAAMDQLIRELIGDRLLELSKYVRIDSLSKRIIIDKTSIINDGYQLTLH